MHERASIARHPIRGGVTVDAEKILIVSDAQHGLTVSLMTLMQPGDVVAAAVTCIAHTPDAPSISEKDSP